MTNTPLSALKPLCAALVLVTATAAGAQSRAPSEPRAIPLREIENLDQLDPQWITGICDLPGLVCGKDDVPTLYGRRVEQDTEYYAVMNNLVLARLSMTAPGQWQLVKRWSFASYPLKPQGNYDDEGKIKLIIHPALYPVSRDLWAIAALRYAVESYSGGGANFTWADFITLDPDVTDVNEKQRLFAEVPFDCSKLVRACILPEHCNIPEKNFEAYRTHDESEGFLTLTFSPSSHGAAYRWTATWHEIFSRGGTLNAKKGKPKLTRAVLKTGKQAVPRGIFPFCQGGPIDDQVE